MNILKPSQANANGECNIESDNELNDLFSSFQKLSDGADVIPKVSKGKRKSKLKKNKLVVGGKSRPSSSLTSSDLNVGGLEESAAMRNIGKNIGYVFKNLGSDWGSVLDPVDSLYCIVVYLVFVSLIMKGISLNINGLGLDCKRNWVRDLVVSECSLFFGIQETKLDSVDPLIVRSLWSRQNVDFIYSSSVGASGGLLTMWDPGAFFMESHVVDTNYLCAFGS
ncbi:RNA-directed DNA polymerase, eukaryota [Tanacetum coccineum]